LGVRTTCMVYKKTQCLCQCRTPHQRICTQTECSDKHSCSRRGRSAVFATTRLAVARWLLITASACADADLVAGLVLSKRLLLHFQLRLKLFHNLPQPLSVASHCRVCAQDGRRCCVCCVVCCGAHPCPSRPPTHCAPSATPMRNHEYTHMGTHQGSKLCGQWAGWVRASRRTGRERLSHSALNKHIANHAVAAPRRLHRLQLLDHEVVLCRLCSHKQQRAMEQPGRALRWG
jgi:hypothetical protein